ncbi:hypothetical protein MY4824_003044 [Beauveria thailandica]
MLGTSAIGGMIAGRINEKGIRVSETVLAGTCLVLLGCGLLTTVDGPEDDAKALGFLAFVGLGFGLSITAVTIMATVKVAPQYRAAAQGTLVQMRILGGSLGIAVSTVLLRREISKRLAGVCDFQDLSALSRGMADLSTQEQDAVRLAYSQAFHNGMVSAVAITCVGILAALASFSTRTIER